MVAGIIIGAIWVIFRIPFDPTWAMIIIGLFIIPGLYAALTAPFVPSARNRRKTMMKLAKITNVDIVYDLGCGDGRIVFEASKKAKKAVGYDLSIPLILWGKLRKLLSYPKAEIHFGNIFKQNFSNADVIFCYLLPGAVKNFHKSIWPTLKIGTRVVCNGFPIKNIKETNSENKVYLYIKK